MPASRIAKANNIMGILSLTLLPLSALVTQFGLFHFRTGLLLFLASALLGLVAVVIAALRTRAQSDETSRRLMSRSALMSLPAIAAFAFSSFSGGDAPMIHNVTTSPDNPPAFVVAPAKRGPEANPLTYSPETAKIQVAAYPDLQPHHSSLSQAAAYERALETAELLGWDIYYQDATEGHIEAVATTRWFGFKDDIAIRISPKDDGSIVDLRSVSRVGKGDLGANARRILKFLDLFENRS